MDINSLTYRERIVLRELRHGKKNVEIAQALYSSETRVKNILFRLFRKTDCPNRTALISWAHQHYFNQKQEA
jgi:LuxR family transcriptional regulator of csgAB operon